MWAEQIYCRDQYDRGNNSGSYGAAWCGKINGYILNIDKTERKRISHAIKLIISASLRVRIANISHTNAD